MFPGPQPFLYGAALLTEDAIWFGYGYPELPADAFSKPPADMTYDDMGVAVDELLVGAVWPG